MAPKTTTTPVVSSSLTITKKKNVAPAFEGKRKNKRGRGPRIADWQTIPTQVIQPPPSNRAFRNIVRTIDFDEVTSTSSLPGLYGFIFVLSDVHDYVDFGSTFDQYRIDRIDFTVRAANQPALPAAGANFAICAFAVDFDSAVNPGTFGDILDYANCVTLMTGESYSVSFVPHVAMSAEITGATTANTVSKGHQWLDLLDPTVIHYGVRLAVRTSTSTNVSTWHIMARYHMSLRSSR